jgi:predicted ATP-dependent serine protease
MKQLGKLQVGIDCENCGTVEGENLNRCVECGRYASDDTSDVCCLKHEVRNSPYPSDECPYCEQERDRRAQIRHQMTRDPRVEPW